ncbi:MAG: 2'-5' RNA ligase, partial [Planctomycetes bacterium RIFOXYD12_FULL_42_12]
MNVRLFVAVEIAEETRKKLTAFQDKLKKAGADVGWVAPENLHITLKFIGYIDEKKTEEVLNIIKDSVTHIKPFNLSYAGVGAFPTPKSPRVI